MTAFMLIFLFIAAAVALFTIISAKNRKKTAGTEKDGVFPFYPVRLMSNPEQQLYWRLVKELPEWLIFPQVQASRVFRVKKGEDSGYWFNRINRLSFDFVVCQKDSTPLVIIELDDKSHESAAAQERDRRKDRLANDAGLTVIRWKSHQIPQNIAQSIRTAVPLFQKET